MKRFRTPFATRRNRDWPSRWLTNRPCSCPPAERIVEPEGECFRCGGRIQWQAPFRPEQRPS